MDFDELRARRAESLKKHKEKKKAYYLKQKMMNNLSRSETSQPKPTYVNYEKELFGGDIKDFMGKIKEIAKKQKSHMVDREKIILEKMKEYKEKKKKYYLENKEERLQYDKEYREREKDNLKDYRKQYYIKNRDRILAKQKKIREKQKALKEQTKNG